MKTEKSLKIPPGHMASLRKVIEKAKNLVEQLERNDAWRKRCRSSNSGLHEKAKRQKQTELKIDPDTDLKSIDNKIDSFEVASKLRRQISKWQKTQSDTYLRGLKEHEHFEIKVHESAQTGDTSLSIAFICSICNKSIPISIRQSSGSYVLSNWTRHVKICRPEKIQGIGSQITMNKFVTTSRQQTIALCNQTSSVTETRQEDTPKVKKAMDALDLQSTKESSQDFLLAPPIISDSVGGAKAKMLDCQESHQVPTTDWS